MTSSTPLNRESEDWVKTIEEEKGYTAVDPEAFKKLLARIPRYEMFHAVLRHTRPGQSILEAGCGWALSSFALAERERSVTALDISAKLVSNLQQLQRELGGSYATNLNIVVGDIFRLTEMRTVFDAIFNDGTYEHFLDERDRQNILQQARDVLRERGMLIVAVPNLNNPFFTSVVDQKMPSMHVFSVQSLAAELERGGFRVRETGFSFVNPGFEQWVKSRWMIGVIRVANVLFRFLPRPLQRIFAAHLYCVAQKVT